MSSKVKRIREAGERARTALKGKERPLREGC